MQLIAKIVDEAPPGSLVILNETFQSTSYDEGASCLGAILRYFSDVGVSYMAATHMMQLRPVMSGRAGFFEVNERHEIRKER